MAEEELISKKELLEKFKISYGALYRWKRKGLIPDEWFIRKSTPTGQETFFARKAVCERVEAILKMRDEDNIPLEKMQEIFYPKKESVKNLVVKGKYGNHTFDISELISVTIENSDGKSVEMIDRIKETEL